MITTRLRSTAINARNEALCRQPKLQKLIQYGAVRGYLPKSIYRRIQPIGVVTLHAPDGSPFRYESFEEDSHGRNIVWRDMRDWEPTTQPLLFSLAKRSEVFVDVGAHTGLYSLLACLANPELRVFACEPNPDLARRIEANVLLNELGDRITIVEAAMSDTSGSATLSVPRKRSHAASLRSPDPGEGAVEVKVKTGDELLAGLPVDLVKIDAEGLEAKVLRGMTEVLRARSPKLVVECLDGAALNSARDVVADLGYHHIFHIGPGCVTSVEASFPGPSAQFSNFLFSTEPYSERGAFSG
ncbi:FkbM family methyltransferase [Streptomyces sp. NPDC018833]|uniref:FkbM family methyltransferase n=1 Tax=Streptomyces sp. NPDC018833 TaxID=3365053 RepID=UPI0037BDA316